MRIYLAYTSALEYWRSYRTSAQGRPPTQFLRFVPVLPSCKMPVGSMLRIPALYGVALPLHALVPRSLRGASAPFLKLHFLSEGPPRRAFFRASDEIFVSSPEYLFLQMARELDNASLSLLGCELCGRYSLSSPFGNGVSYWLEPITSTRRLGRFIADNRGRTGIKNARRAMRSICDGLASPAEAAVMLLLCLPRLQGGYGLPLPLANHAVSVLGNGRKATRYCDLHWPQYKIAVEYDSDEFHSASAKISKDSIRRAELQEAGIDVITVAKEQLYDCRRFDQIAKILSKKMHRRFYPEDLELAGRRSALRSILLGRQI